jgi:hypothetical protein
MSWALIGWTLRVNPVELTRPAQQYRNRKRNV